MKKKIICLDPGHGMSNRHHLKYDTGTVHAGVAEADIVMKWVNCLRGILRTRGHTVIRTRVDEKDPAPVSRRDDIAVAYGCEVMFSFHVNCCTGQGGTEVFYRGSDDRAFAALLSKTVSEVMGIPDRGAKTEQGSQHTSLAVLNFDKCWLIELGFITHPTDRAKMTDDQVMQKTCVALADAIETYP